MCLREVRIEERETAEEENMRKVRQTNIELKFVMTSEKSPLTEPKRQLFLPSN
jgi:hypothetical protein